MEEETREQRLARYRELVNDPIAKAVANLIQPNQAEAFNEDEALEFMRSDSVGFANRINRVLQRLPYDGNKFFISPS